MKKIHLALPGYHSEVWMDKSFCGIPFADYEEKFITRNKKKVTCKKCKKEENKMRLS